mgnify:CR=1 FL=1
MPLQSNQSAKALLRPALVQVYLYWERGMCVSGTLYCTEQQPKAPAAPYGMGLMENGMGNENGIALLFPHELRSDIPFPRYQPHSPHLLPIEGSWGASETRDALSAVDLACGLFFAMFVSIFSFF